MFIRIKKSKNSPKCSVQIVESKRVDGKVKQKIVKHMGTAMEGEALESLKALAESVKLRMEQSGQLALYDEPVSVSETKESSVNKEAFNVNLLDIKEERRVIKGIHDVYGKLYDELGFNGIITNPARNKRSQEALKEIVTQFLPVAGLCHWQLPAGVSPLQDVRPSMTLPGIDLTCTSFACH